MRHIPRLFTVSAALALLLALGCAKPKATDGAPVDKAAAAAPTAAAKAAPVAAAAAAPAKAAPVDKAAPTEAAAAKKDFGLKKDGEKRWQMDDHTRGAMAKIAKLVADQSALTTVEAHHALGAKLQAELKVLVRGCTMDGPNHDMLHVYLSALFPRVGVIEKGATLPALQKALAETKRLTAVYPVYFE